MKKRILSVLMVLCLVLAAVPTALAGEEDTMPESPGEEAGETTPEGAAPNGDTAPEDGNGETTTPDGGDGETQEETRDTAPSPVNDVAVQAEGDVPQVTMDNMLVEMKSQGQKMSYSIESAEYADQIEFVELMQAEDGELVENTDGDWGIGLTDHKASITKNTTDGIWRIQAPTQVVKAGQYVSTWVGAKYNGEIIASCTVQYIPNDNTSRVSYTGENQETITSINTFGGPTTLQAHLDDDTKYGEAITVTNVTGWRWASDDSEILGVEIDPQDSSKANVTVYQHTNDSTYLAAAPEVETADGTKYVYIPGFSEGHPRVNISSGNRPVQADHNSFKAGDEVTFTFDTQRIVGYDTDTASITWSSSDPSLIPIPDDATGSEVTVDTIRKGFTPSPKTITVTASVTVNGHLYSGYISMYLYSNPIPVENPVQSYEELRQLITNGETTVSITQTITLDTGDDLGLTGITVMRPDSLTGSLFHVIGDVTITGGNTGVIDGNYLGDDSMITVAATGDLTLENITLQNSNNSNGKGGAVSVDKGILNCTNVNFQNNRVQGTPDTENPEVNQYNGGAIYVDRGTANIDNCVFTENTVGYGNGGAIYFDQASGVIHNSKFDQCKITECIDDTYDNPADGNGGAIYCRIPDGEVEILDNKITNCTAQTNGGGISVIADTDSVVTLDGNVIQNCTAGERGGGMSLITPVYDPETDGNRRTITLLTGEISGCHASWGGGIDYTGHGMETLYLQNVKITSNRAVRGAGIWACPTSMTDSYTTLGGAIYGNDADMPQGVNTGRPSGDEIRYESGDEQTKKEDSTITRPTGWNDGDTYMTVMDRALGGGLMAWYQDEQDDRYQAGNAEADPSLYTNTSSSFSLHGELSEAHQALAEAEARLIITGNTAESRGGGIATNSPIVIGMEGYDKTVTVKKVWSGSETHPASVNVTLVRLDANNNHEDLETVTLSEDNEWTATFEDLPGLYEDENGAQHNYTYTVREDTIANWNGTVAVVEDNDSDDNTITLVITNTYQPDPGPGGGGGTTTPDPDPDDKDDDDPEPTPTPTPTPNPDIPATPDNPDTPDTPNQPDTPSEPVSPSDPGVPQTSDTSLTGLWLALCLLALGGLGLLRFTQPRRGGRRARR